MTKAPAKSFSGLRRRSARPLGDLVADLVDPILARKAGMTTGLIAAWPEIAGPRLAQGCRPEKLIWPPRRAENDPFQPATLVIACEGAFALRLQHQTTELLQRIDAFFGYHAVARLKIVQRALPPAPPSRKPVLRPLDDDDRSIIRATTAQIENPRLKAALEAFGEAVLARNAKRED